MADNKRTLGYRTNDPVGRQRPAAPADTSNDPLAELARLIGQQNESLAADRPKSAAAPVPRATPTPAPRAQMPRSTSFEPRLGAPRATPETGADTSAALSSSGYADPYPSQAGYDEGYSEPRYDTGARYADPSFGSSDYPASNAAGENYAGSNSDPRYADQPYQDESYQEPRYPAASGYAESGYQSQPQSPSRSRAAPGYPDAGYGQQSYGSRSAYSQPQDQKSYNARSYAGASGYSDPYVGDYAQADDGAPSPRRRGLVTVLAVFALAVVGTAGAYGVRSLLGGSRTPATPPVIEADARPTKIVPASEASTKPIQDRIGAGGERVISREETPVELRDPARAGQPRVIFPDLAGQNQQASAGATGSTPAVSAEPKRVRTVTIRPDMSVDTAPAAPVAPSPRNVQPLADPEPEPTASSPLALAPTIQTQAPAPAAPVPAPAPAQRQAARTPAASGSPFPAPISSGSSAAAVGGYAVQVTSQRSEADARASYRSLQQQFPSVLGNRQPVIRRADLGSKGTYYRAQIQFGSQGEASTFCNSLKAAGGQCVVQRN